MDKGREMHEAVANELFGRQSEDRLHRKSPNVVYIDGEAGDGKIRAALDAADGKQTIIVISDHHFNGMDDELKALIEGRHPMQKKIKTMTLGDIIKMPPKEFLQEHDNLPPEKP